MFSYQRLDDWPGQPAEAFIKTDFVFLDRRKRRLNPRETLPAHEPIAVYRSSTGERAFITDSDVNQHLRFAAHKVLGIPLDDPELQKWSTHSIRVMAANLLHRQHFSDSYFQNRLRWKSTAFKKYLRNTFYTADQHTLHLSDENLPPLPQRGGLRRGSEPHERLTDAKASAHNSHTSDLVVGGTIRLASESSSGTDWYSQANTNLALLLENLDTTISCLAWDSPRVLRPIQTQACGHQEARTEGATEVF
ncbi:hypothetical protein THAOC_13004 [Thalassiosira oceanica]|uniref:Uncharacterized protein n=1 Tax=Thalassiosira oceanica TaxID=159749 RepID=K0SYM9_THAOC|nr:hypothetical protein THAOC_13004 [Thalassiosira oceanica]|eukprot:EJK66091.1 hypothetical protein THAOC_13004 [Thalassiosira oceanica]